MATEVERAVERLARQIAAWKMGLVNDKGGSMVALSRVQNVIDRWFIKTMSTQFSGPEYHVCDRPGSYGIVGRVFKDYAKAEAKLSELRAQDIQKLFNSY